jgi:hypothetical protein
VFRWIGKEASCQYEEEGHQGILEARLAMHDEDECQRPSDDDEEGQEEGFVLSASQ